MALDTNQFLIALFDPPCPNACRQTPDGSIVQEEGIEAGANAQFRHSRGQSRRSLAVVAPAGFEPTLTELFGSGSARTAGWAQPSTWAAALAAER
jgi:hypothetical protein